MNKNTNWEKTRSKGFLRFIVSEGMGWGVMVYVILQIIQSLKNQEFTFPLVDLIFWLIAGVIYGVIMWNYFNRCFSDKE